MMDRHYGGEGGAAPAATQPQGQSAVPGTDKTADRVEGADQIQNQGQTQIQTDAKPLTLEDWQKRAQDAEARATKLEGDLRHNRKKFQDRMANYKQGAVRVERQEVEPEVNDDNQLTAKGFKEVQLSALSEMRAREAEADATDFISDYLRSAYGWQQQDVESMFSRFNDFIAGKLPLEAQVDLILQSAAGQNIEQAKEAIRKAGYDEGYAKAMEKVSGLLPGEMSGGSGSSKLPTPPAMVTPVHPQTAMLTRMNEAAARLRGK